MHPVFLQKYNILGVFPSIFRQKWIFSADFPSRNNEWPVKMSFELPNCRSPLEMDDNLADYRRFCANRLQRLERCKKTKSFCNLEDEIPHSVAISCSDLITMESEIPVFPDSTILVTRCSETGTNTFCSRSPALPTDTSLSGSTKVSGIKIPSSAAKPNSAKLSPISGSWLANSRKCTANFIQIDNEGVNNRHLPQSSCSSPYSLYTIPSSTLSSTMSTKKPQLGMARGSMTVINNGNGCGDQGGQRNFDLLREKMVNFANVVFSSLFTLFWLLLKL